MWLRLQLVLGFGLRLLRQLLIHAEQSFVIR
jgi:hypothetical protein